jgi:hypothetical protein
MYPTSDIEEIPMPAILDPYEVVLVRADNERRSVKGQRGAHRVEELCEYGAQLWHEVDALRHYLLQSLPEEAGGARASGNVPADMHDDAAWSNWINAYAHATAVLAGPNGDMGYGLEEARRQAQLHRNAQR